jgi:hypothetical protein
MASFSATVNIPTNAAPGAYSIAINTADTAGQPTASVGIPLSIQQDYQIGTITLASGSTASVSAGGSASYNFGVVPVGANYNGNITLGCVVSPATTTISCALKPTSVNPSNQSSAVMMTVSTQGRSVSQSAKWFSGIAGLALLLPAMGVFGGRRSRRCRQLAVGALLVCTLSCGGGASGGGGGGGGTPPGTYTMTVTGNPSSVSEPNGQSAQLQVN